MKVGSLALALLILVPFGIAVSDQAEAAPTFTRANYYVKSFDNTELAATVFTPAGAGKFPAIIMTHGWAQNRFQMESLAERYAAAGYLVLIYDARGWGNSGGQVTLDGPAEVRDVSSMINFLKILGRVKFEGTGSSDPIVGMRGVSYAGAVQLLAAANDARIDAIVPEVTWNDLARSLLPRDVLKSGWVDLLYAAAKRYGNAHPMLDDWYRAAKTTGITPAIRAELAARSPAFVLDRVTVPTLVVHGWRDTLFLPDEAIATYTTLRDQGNDVGLMIHGGGHGYEIGTGNEHVNARIDAFFAQHLKGQTPVEAPPRVELYDMVAASWAGYPDYPVASSHARYFVGGAVLSTAGPSPRGAQGDTLHNSVAPTSTSQVPNFQSQANLPARDSPGTTLNYVSAPMKEERHVLGAPNATIYLRAKTAAGAQLFLKLYDVDPAGQATLILRQVTPVKLALVQGQVTRVDLPLASIDHTLATGHVLQFSISTTDAFWEANRGGPVDIFHDEDRPSQIWIPLR